ncbi:MAG: transketolase [Alphaproteobacteria bacterium]|nr:transketolase [Alphaproteobacteria bacterium]
MRNAFASTVIAQSNTPDSFFLSGDLGFMALEGVRDAFGSRFVNVGVAEQNMIGVAAGLAREGMKVIAYSIAPFAYARPFEQIRNDICLGKLPVCIVGNGGGYAYGYMGPTHHALEDCAAMHALGLRVLVPAFDEDLAGQMVEVSAPTYLRLGYDARPKGTTAPAYAPWREVLSGKNGVLAALGPLAGVAWGALQDMPEAERPAVWAVCEFTPPPVAFLSAAQGNPLHVVEEHVAAGGLGAYLSLLLHSEGAAASTFHHRHALGYPSGTYGSQNFHRAECGLDAAGILALVKGQTA